VQHQNQTTGGGGTSNFEITDLKIYNNSTSAPTTATWTIESPPTAGLKLWLDADDSSTFTFSSSNLVSQWNDKSGQGNHISQATTAYQPLRVLNALSGRATVQADGSNDTISRSTFTGGSIPQAVTTFIVLKMPDSGVDTTANRYVYSSTSHLFIARYTTNQNLMYAGAEYKVGSIDSSNYLLYTLEYNGTSSIFRRAKTTIGTGDASTSGMNGIELFASGGQNSNAKIAEILIYDTTLSTSDRDDIEQYLTAKWGL
jgi:hypothetical protein